MTLAIDRSSPPPFDALPELLTTEGYARVPMVLEPGEFSVRGSLVDVFPVNHAQPIRLDYFDDELDRLVSFDVQSQRSLSELTETSIQSVESAEKTRFTAFEGAGETYGLLSQFSEGDLVVHETYGLGRFDGLKRMDLRGYESEYVQLVYRGGDRVFVPLDQLSRLHRYADTGQHPSLNKLGDGRWDQTKQRVQRATLLFVEGLYQTYKKRLKAEGFSCQEDSEAQVLFESHFPHPLTPDQSTSIAAIKSDMEQPMPMDRLLCGDVGYGKTEVILRAAFKAADNHKQVVVIAPTTVLAAQHFETFSKRFEPFPMRVALLTRFTSPAQTKKILSDLKNHTLDVVIGTHRLLSKHINFADLGLFVVDEEQRFGVSHKEQIKERYPLVDYLSVSATPIPRTMYLSLSGVKPFLAIETPPQNRKPVLTCVEPMSSELIKEAISRELERSGQVFYLHNRVQKLHEKKRLLTTLFPSCRVGIVHGQLPLSEIDRTMMQFRHHELDILVSTTIIENGLDLPNANTIIIDGAERLGLSQIHQLRGRVGRTSRQGYAYLLHDPDVSLTEDAMKRLNAIREYAVLGAGYKLALKDLEIRGAGTLLGHQQSGHLTSIGFDLYCKLLNQAMTGNFASDASAVWSVDKLKKQAYLPEDYIPNTKERLAIYDRLSRLSTASDIQDIEQELTDRYGELPYSVGLFLAGIRDQFERL